MIYLKALTIPPNTPEKTPVSIVFLAPARNLKNIAIYFPDGALDSTFVRVLEGGRQLFPASGWVAGNNETIADDSNHRLTDLRRLVLEGYSLAEDWPHTIQISFKVE